VTGSTYTYRVRAVNEIGFSGYSDEHYVIAARAADEPTSMTLISSTESTITFYWNEPYDGGSPITYYKVYWDDGLQGAFTLYAFTVDPDNNFVVNDGLTAGVYYSFKVVSVNLVGES
jgi:predicted phage tail protein